MINSETVTLQARVDFANGTAGFPDSLWFKFPRRFEPILSSGTEPFVVALSSLASALDEPIDLAGQFSEHLSIGFEEYWTIINCWDPQRYHRVALNCSDFAAEASTSGPAAAMFSGGVDSFFTLFRGLEARSTHRIRYALFIHGLDIPLSQKRTYDAAADAYDDALRRLGIELVRAETNVRKFVPPAHWEMGHGSALIGTALTLAGGVRRLFVPSSKSYTTLEPWGSHPLIDGLLSTDQFQIIHDGARCTRFDKLQAMRDWEVIRPLLRTCYEQPDAFRNCGRCNKCRRTMMILAALGILDEFESFPAIKSPMHFLNTSWETRHERLFGKQAIACAASNGRTGLAWVGRIAMQTSRVRQVGKDLKVWSRPFRHRLRSKVQQAWAKQV